MSNVSLGDRIKLSAMMFFQFMIVAVFFIQLAPYLNKLEMNSTLVSLIVSSMAIGCLASPIVGMIADRHFAGQKVLGVLNLVGAVMLFLAAMTTSGIPLFILLLAFMICYMPSWGLTSAIAMSNTPPEKFPQVRVFGSIGWVASIIFGLVAKWCFDGEIVDGVVTGKIIDGTNIPLYIGAAVSLIAGINAFFLPNTPPPAKGQPASVIDALGLRALVLMKDASFAVFILCSFLVMLPFGIYWSYNGAFLADKGYEMVTAVTYIGQGVEIFLMLLVPVAMAKLGVKKTMAIGLAAQVVRFLAYYAADVSGVMPIMFAGIMVHGAIFGFFFVGGQIYIGQRAPKEIQAQAQGFIFLVNLGLGLLIANFVNGWLIEKFKVITPGVDGGKDVISWSKIWLIQLVASIVVLVIFWLFFNHKDEEAAVEAPAVDAPAEDAPAEEQEDEQADA